MSLTSKLRFLMLHVIRQKIPKKWWIIRRNTKEQRGNLIENTTKNISSGQLQDRLKLHAKIRANISDEQKKKIEEKNTSEHREWDGERGTTKKIKKSTRILDATYNYKSSYSSIATLPHDLFAIRFSVSFFFFFYLLSSRGKLRRCHGTGRILP